MPATPALLLLAALAQAAAPDPSSALSALGFKVVQPMTADQLAETRSRVDSEIARTGAPAGVLENVTDANGGRVRHTPSRLTCALGAPGQAVREAGPERMACETRTGETLYRLGVVRAPSGATLESVAADAGAAARREPGYAPVPGPVAVGHPRPGSGLPDHRTLVFRSRVDGRERWSREMVGLVDGWVLTERSLAPAAPAGFSMADLVMEASFGSQMRPPTPTPPPAGP